MTIGVDVTKPLLDRIAQDKRHIHWPLSATAGLQKPCFPVFLFMRSEYFYIVTSSHVRIPSIATYYMETNIALSMTHPEEQLAAS